MGRFHVIVLIAGNVFVNKLFNREIQVFKSKIFEIKFHFVYYVVTIKLNLSISQWFNSLLIDF